MLQYENNAASSTLQRKKANWFIAVILSLGATSTLLPFLIILMTALTKDAYRMSFPYNFIPDPWYWQNIIDVWEMIPFAKGLLNTLTVAVTVTVVTMLVSSLAAFSFAKLDFPFKEQLFMLLLSTMMVPYAVVLIPQFVGFSRLHWVDTLLPLIVPGCFGNIAIIFFLRQYFKSIPDELIQSSKIDGAGYPLIFWKVVLPLGAPALAAQGILTFMGIWNDFFAPVIYLNTPEKQTIQVLISNFSGVNVSNYSMIMAGSLQTMLPLIILFLLAQRFIIDSLMITGIKG